MDANARDRRRGRGRSGSLTSSTGFGGPDPQRESELSVATDNLTLEEIEGNVFRMSKDQVRRVHIVTTVSGGRAVWLRGKARLFCAASQ